ncbi:hypothetical protein [Actinoplanes rectilineatus]|uniref:hypothetical protein n=1 Tax=Actinoplanes rectilineatus TaxID=113571 RepID=UPI0005F2E633|nr:hypothetical protein [Actinoplanes rectilineatus]
MVGLAGHRDVAAALTVTASTAGCDTGKASTDPAALDEVAHRLRVTGEADYADSFSAVEITDRVRVFRKANDAFDRWVTGEFTDACVEILDVPYSGKQIQAILDRVEADRGYWESQGVVLNTVSVDVDGTIKVGVDGEKVDAVQEKMNDRYDQPVQVRGQGAVPPAIGAPG